MLFIPQLAFMVASCCQLAYLASGSLDESKGNVSSTMSFDMLLFNETRIFEMTKDNNILIESDGCDGICDMKSVRTCMMSNTESHLFWIGWCFVIIFLLSLLINVALIWKMRIDKKTIKTLITLNINKNKQDKREKQREKQKKEENHDRDRPRLQNINTQSNEISITSMTDRAIASNYNIQLTNNLSDNNNSNNNNNISVNKKYALIDRMLSTTIIPNRMVNNNNNNNNNDLSIGNGKSDVDLSMASNIGGLPRLPNSVNSNYNNTNNNNSNNNNYYDNDQSIENTKNNDSSINDIINNFNDESVSNVLNRRGTDNVTINDMLVASRVASSYSVNVLSDAINDTYDNNV